MVSPILVDERFGGKDWLNGDQPAAVQPVLPVRLEVEAEVRTVGSAGQEVERRSVFHSPKAVTAF